MPNVLQITYVTLIVIEFIIFSVFLALKAEFEIYWNVDDKSLKFQDYSSFLKNFQFYDKT